MEKGTSIEDIILLELWNYYTNEGDFKYKSGTSYTIVDKKRVISRSSNGKYVDNLKKILSQVGELEFDEVRENSKSNYVKRLLYKDNESKKGMLTKNFKFSGCNEGSILYLATTTAGNKNDVTIQDILERIIGKKEESEEIAKMRFESNFTFEKKWTLGKETEKEITLNVNNAYKKYFYHFVIVDGKNIEVGDPFSFISQKQMIKRDFIETKKKEYERGIKNDVYYYYKMLYNSEKNDFNEEFVSHINFYSRFEEKNALEEMISEEIEYQEGINDTLINEDEILKLLETDYQNINYDSLMREDGMYLSPKINDDPIKDINLSPCISDDHAMDSINLSPYESEDHIMEYINPSFCLSDSYESQNLTEDTLSKPLISEVPCELLMESNLSSSTSNYSQNNIVEVNEQNEESQFIGGIFYNMNVYLGGIYLENNVYIIKSNNNMNEIVGGIMTINGSDVVITNDFIGRIVVKEDNYLLYDEDKLIGVFNLFNGNFYLNLIDMNNLFANHFMANHFMENVNSSLCLDNNLLAFHLMENVNASLFSDYISN